VPIASDQLIAIDVLLEPDRTMVSRSEAVNARLRANYPAGYQLDATHAPHVTAGLLRGSAILYVWITCPECRDRRWTG
jgi:hypothetical protein